MSVVKLDPAYKDYIWGGTRLHDEFGKRSSTERIAESWELACRSDGESCKHGTDITLSQYISRKGKEVLGTNCQGCKAFPLLIKLIDASDDLSVQVHPDDEYALIHEGESGKTEMWFILDCEQDSQLICGFEHDISKSEFETAVKNGTLLDKVRKVPVKKGDVFFIPPNTLHAIGKGILLAEIQQNSNTTYRVYDYGRLGNDGKPRELHIAQALEITDTSRAAPTERFETVRANGFEYRKLAECEYFTAVSFDVTKSVKLMINEKSFAHILMYSGSAEITSENTLCAKKGDSLFIDAASGEMTVSGKCSFILTRCGCGFSEGTDKLVEE